MSPDPASSGRVTTRRAIIMAGGEGARLRPYTAVLPKPLMPIGDRPVLDIVIRQLRAAGFGPITIATGYLAELIEAFFRDGASYGVPIDYFREREPHARDAVVCLPRYVFTHFGTTEARCTNRCH